MFKFEYFLDRVEEELHKTKSTGNTSIQLQLNKLHKEISQHHDSTLVDNPLHANAKLGPKHPKFSYHRVTSPQRGGRGRPFAAVTIAISDQQQGDHQGSQIQVSKAATTFTNPILRSGQENEHDYPADEHHYSEKYDTLLKDDLNQIETFEHSEEFQSVPKHPSRDQQIGESSHHFGNVDENHRLNHDDASLRKVEFRHHQSRRRHHRRSSLKYGKNGQYHKTFNNYYLTGEDEVNGEVHQKHHHEKQIHNKHQHNHHSAVENHPPRYESVY